ncbi:murein hydrolase activator EnvC family protein, partial [Brevundimonas sp.]|uniref:murein hydrolase activator EnvC family protein n=1 Tax=Brevundimonas sp. TaxID=1871086 RepID=UPI002AB9BA73
QMMTLRPPPPLLIPSDRAVDTVRAAILMTAMAPALQAQAEGLTGRQAELGRVRRLAVLGSERLFTTESDQGDRRAELEGTIARKSDLQTVLEAEATEAKRAAGVLERRILALGGTVPVPDRETARTVTRLPGGRSRLTPPVAGAPVQRFGGSSRGWRWAATGGLVRAPAAARVVHAGPLDGWGQVVILDLGPGWRVVLAGVGSVSVTTGDRVGDGQVLGTAGRSGDIHMELRRDERPVDPSPWLR